MICYIAAGNCGIPFIMSTVSTCTLKEISDCAPNTNKWFQLYIYKNRNLTEDLVREAEKLGFKALVLTVDVATFGLRRANMRSEFKLDPQYDLPHITQISGNVESGRGSLKIFVEKMFDASLCWKDVEWLMK